MIQYHAFTFNFVSEETYLLWDETLAACVIDPGCSTPVEQKQLLDFITLHSLRLERSICTHYHFDHCLGAEFVCQEWGITTEVPVVDLEQLPPIASQVALFGLPCEAPSSASFSPLPITEPLRFGVSKLQILSVPGHTPGHVAFYSPESRLLFSGDTLFYQSIGRTDLWGGDYDSLITAISSRLMALPDDVVVLPGHRPPTTIGAERLQNPYFQH